jgi:hypothetical protein|tara:strand:+ start:3213 stop:3704 length:492 start_codon:yes stop_codon:yes gene_type:complete
MSDKKWKQPDSPPPPLFVGKKERDLIKQVNDELIERVIGQAILYYPIDVERTNFHPIYGEAIEKNFLPPIRVYALVEWNAYGTEYSQNIGVDQRVEITVHFHERRLQEDQDLYVRAGDFVLYGGVYYELVDWAEPRKIYGQVDHSIEISAKCVRARPGVFNGT